ILSSSLPPPPFPLSSVPPLLVDASQPVGLSARRLLARPAARQVGKIAATALRRGGRTPHPPILPPPFLILHSFTPPFLHSSTRDGSPCRADARPPPAAPPSSLPHPPFPRSPAPPPLFPLILPTPHPPLVAARPSGGRT